MSFIEQDEHIIILDYNCYSGLALNDAELSRLHDSGIKTVMCYLQWRFIEPVMGVYDWTDIEERLEAYQKAGLKAIIKTYLGAPGFFPDDWYLRGSNGDIQRHVGEPNIDGSCPVSCLSYWNPMAWDYHLRFIERVCERFSDPNTLCINIAPANGEALIPGNNYLYDDYAVASFRQFTGTNNYPSTAIPGTPTLDWLRETVIPGQVETQKMFQKCGGEYWTMLHHAFETIPSTGNWLIDDLYTALHKELGHNHWGICYTLYRPGETRGLWGARQDIDRHGVKMLFASEGPAGLYTNTQNAISQGARGMITGPLAPYLGSNGRMADWMYEAIRDTSQWWKK
jgi:hypothetical protein